ncbi:MAG TPA: sugar phosphate isomerase/epimerase family protein [Cyclobacteriaceae bacterium]|nr:sugar phosphate isomerase/epimerase family protein [Cyclobacteriaceae bacterium]
MTRKEFITSTGFSLAAVSLPSFSFNELKENKTLTIGLCGNWDKSSLAKQSGCTYIESGVANLLMPDKSDAEFKNQFDALAATQLLPVECFNVFIPKELKSVGDQANHEGIVKYASVAFQRAEIIGAKLIVFGSSGSRTIPDGFDRSKAKEQFTSLCKQLSPIAAKHNITVAIETLNRSETNFLNTLKESVEIVEAVQHPNLKLMCDIYHALKENDPASELVKYKKHLVHCHIAEKQDRTAPGVKGDDFKPYFNALKKINYKGRISLECKWNNLETELPVAVKVLREQYENA